MGSRAEVLDQGPAAAVPQPGKPGGTGVCARIIRQRVRKCKEASGLARTSASFDPCPLAVQRALPEGRSPQTINFVQDRRIRLKGVLWGKRRGPVSGRGSGTLESLQARCFSTRYSCSSECRFMSRWNKNESGPGIPEPLSLCGTGGLLHKHQPACLREIAGPASGVPRRGGVRTADPQLVQIHACWKM